MIILHTDQPSKELTESISFFILNVSLTILVPMCVKSLGWTSVFQIKLSEHIDLFVSFLSLSLSPLSPLLFCLFICFETEFHCVAWSSLYRPGKPQTHKRLSAFASCVLGFRVCATRSSSYFFPRKQSRLHSAAGWPQTFSNPPVSTLESSVSQAQATTAN